MTSFYYSIVTLQSKSGIPKVKINATLGKYWPSSGYKVVNKLFVAYLFNPIVLKLQLTKRLRLLT